MLLLEAVWRIDCIHYSKEPHEIIWIYLKLIKNATQVSVSCSSYYHRMNFNAGNFIQFHADTYTFMHISPTDYHTSAYQHVWINSKSFNIVFMHIFACVRFQCTLGCTVSTQNIRKLLPWVFKTFCLSIRFVPLFRHNAQSFNQDSTHRPPANNICKYISLRVVNRSIILYILSPYAWKIFPESHVQRTGPELSRINVKFNISNLITESIWCWNDWGSFQQHRGICKIEISEDLFFKMESKCDMKPIGDYLNLHNGNFGFDS